MCPLDCPQLFVLCTPPASLAKQMFTHGAPTMCRAPDSPVRWASSSFTDKETQLPGQCLLPRPESHSEPGGFSLSWQLKQQECLVLESWGPKMQHQTHSRAGPSEGCEGESGPGLPQLRVVCWQSGGSLADRSSPSSSRHSLNVHVCLLTSPFPKDTSHPDTGPTLLRCDLALTPSPVTPFPHRSHS